MILPPIKRVGYFHFGSDHTRPIVSLEATLDRKRSEVTDAVIVLPEAFNICKDYYADVPCNYDPTVLLQLQRLSGIFGVSFVAGLIIQIPNGPYPPYSRAYLIDATGAGLMCHKHCPDNTGQRDGHPHNYTPCDDGCDPHNVVIYRGVCLTAVICMDARIGNECREFNKRRYEHLWSRMVGVSEGVARIVCIPACMSGTKETGDAIAKLWPDCYVLMSNSYGNQPGSFVVSIDLEETGTRVRELQRTFIPHNDIAVVEL
jgi:predicted amidohydrolase